MEAVSIMHSQINHTALSCSNPTYLFADYTEIHCLKVESKG